MEVLEAVNGGPLQFSNRKLLMLLIYNSSSSLHCICTLYIHGGVRTSHGREKHCNSRKKYSRASRKKLIQIISVEYFQKLFKLDGTLIVTAVSNSKCYFFNTLCKPSSATAHGLYILFTLFHCLHCPHCLHCFYTAHTAYTTCTAKHCLHNGKNANIYCYMV